MKCKRQTILTHLQESFRKHAEWTAKLSPERANGFAIHLAILREPYLTFIMEGKKKVETRFAKRACPPFERIADGDVVILKKAGGEIVGICEVEKVWFYRLDSKSLARIKEQFGERICPVDGSFWTERRTKSVATLMLIKNVVRVNGFRIDKRDRRGWVTFDPERQPSLFKE